MALQNWFEDNTDGTKQIGVDPAGITTGTTVTLAFTNGDPNGSITAIQGSLAIDVAMPELYLKTNGTGNTDWKPLGRVVIYSLAELANYPIGTIADFFDLDDPENTEVGRWEVIDPATNNGFEYRQNDRSNGVSIEALAGLLNF